MPTHFEPLNQFIKETYLALNAVNRLIDYLVFGTIDNA